MQKPITTNHRNDRYSSVSRWMTLIFLVLLLGLLLYAIFCTNYFSSGRQIFWGALTVALIFQFVFHLSIERRLGNFAISVSLLTLVQVFTLVGTLFLADSNRFFDVKNLLFWPTTFLLALNVLINLFLIIQYQKMRKQWKKFLKQQLVEIFDTKFNNEGPKDCGMPRTIGDFYTDLAELIIEQNFVPNSITQGIEKFFSDNDQIPRDEQRLAFVSLLESQGYKVPAQAFQMSVDKSGRLALIYLIFGWLSFALFVTVVVLASLAVG